jgi:hypothetical protein
MVESFKRYYHNSFLDGQRQEAYNLFLGNYIFAQGQPMLWDLATDYYLHHADPRAWSDKRRRSYIKWYTPEYLEKKTISPQTAPRAGAKARRVSFFDDYWLEYYRPLSLSSFFKTFSYVSNMNSTLRYIPFKSTQEGRYDLSPFRVRTGTDLEVPEKKKTRKGVTILDPQDEMSDDAKSGASTSMKSTSIQRFLQPQVSSDDAKSGASTSMKSTSLQRFLQPQVSSNNTHQSIVKDPQLSSSEQSKRKKSAPDKALMTQWTLAQFHYDSLNPSITKSERDEYKRYISHPLNLPLVVSTELPPDTNSEFVDYINSVPRDTGSNLQISEEDIADYTEFVRVSENPLTVSDDDFSKKRYKAYRQWLKGKSLFKQQRVDS